MSGCSTLNTVYGNEGNKIQCATTHAATHGNLPFTGINLAVFVALGVALIITGVLIATWPRSK